MGLEDVDSPSDVLVPWTIRSQTLTGREIEYEAIDVEVLRV